MPWSVGATIAVVFVFKFFVPATANFVAQALPLETQQALGEAVVERLVGLLASKFRSGPGPGGDIKLWPIGRLDVQFPSGPGPVVCTSTAGSAALAELTQRLADQMATPLPINVRVLDFDAINILALPGGQILVFSGLLNYAENPEEVAGLLAHSMAHVMRRQLMQKWIMEEGVGALVRLFVGGSLVGDDAVIASLAELGLRTSNIQLAEMEADRTALDLIGAAGINALPLADFIDRLPGLARDLEGTVEDVIYQLSVVHTHPPSPERSAMIRTRAKRLGPAMSDQQWAALRRICA